MIRLFCDLCGEETECLRGMSIALPHGIDEHCECRMIVKLSFESESCTGTPCFCGACRVVIASALLRRAVSDQAHVHAPE